MTTAYLDCRAKLIVFLTFALTTPLCAQYSSRAEEIEAQRKQKAASLSPEVTTKTESTLVEIRERRILEKIQYGWHGLRPVFGGLATGQGFAFGGEYLNDEIGDGNVVFRVSARGSIRKASRLESGIAFPKLAHGAVFADLSAHYLDYPQMQYYGPGPKSRKEGRSNFLLEQTFAGGTVGLRPLPKLRLGVTGGYLMINVGPGRRPGWAETQKLYSPLQAPGVERQTNYTQGGGFVQLDYRDIPGGPRSGGNYIAQFTYNRDEEFAGRYTFRRLDLEAQQYIPLFNRRRVIALRGKSVTTYTNRGQVVPFYMQPTLGGSEDLRGFRPYRFYDNNVIVFNAEYRYEIFSGLDMAIFGDAGKVFADRHDWNVRNLEGAYGFGFRFNARNVVFLRIDTGFSREGWQIWFKFNNVF